MTVKGLIYELENFDEDMEVLIQSTNTIYADSIYGAEEKELRSFYGNDREVLVIVARDQVGAVD